MYIYLYAEEDGDMVADTRYDQTTAFYNLIKDASETAAECGFGKIPVVQLGEGVYDFYSGYADTANGSGIPRSVPIIGAAGVSIRGMGADQTILRLHGTMQWLFAIACADLRISDMTIEYADEMQFAPCTNPHKPRLRSVGQPMENDNDTMLFLGCKSVRLERMKLFGAHLSIRFDACEDFLLRDVSGNIPIRLTDCFGDFYGLSLRCPTVTEQTGEGSLLVAKDFVKVKNAVLCDEAVQPEEKTEETEKQQPIILSLEDYR